MQATPPWTDPRGHPSPSLSAIARASDETPETILELLDLIKGGRLYSIEKWIQEGRPIQARSYRLEKRSASTPMSAAIESRQHDLVLLFLCNGYDPNADPICHLDTALRLRAWDIVDLLLDWGADPTKVEPEYVLDTYRSDLMERFLSLGTDFITSHPLASYLSYNTRNRPAYGWVKRHKEEPDFAKELAIALYDVVTAPEAHDKAVALLLWAGADPHMRVPSLRWASSEEDEETWGTPIEGAVTWGRGAYLTKMKLDSAKDDIDGLWDRVNDVAALDALAAVKTPSDWSRVIRRNLSHLAFEYGRSSFESERCLDRISDHYGGRLTTLEERDMKWLRRELLRLKNSYTFEWIIRWLRKPAHCDAAVFVELTRTPAMMERMERVGFGSHYLDVTSGPTGYKKKVRRRPKKSV